MFPNSKTTSFYRPLFFWSEYFYGSECYIRNRCELKGLKKKKKKNHTDENEYMSKLDGVCCNLA